MTVRLYVFSLENTMRLENPLVRFFPLVHVIVLWVKGATPGWPASHQLYPVARGTLDGGGAGRK